MDEQLQFLLSKYQVTKDPLDAVTFAEAAAQNFSKKSFIYAVSTEYLGDDPPFEQVDSCHFTKRGAVISAVKLVASNIPPSSDFSNGPPEFFTEFRKSQILILEDFYKKKKYYKFLKHYLDIMTSTDLRLTEGINRVGKLKVSY